jgi:hypothetical protein
MRSRSVVLLLCLLSVASCSGRRTETGSIPEAAFVRLYADILISREEQTLRGVGGAGGAAPDSLYRAYGVRPAEVDSTLKQYQSDLPSWKAFHEKVRQRLEFLQQQMASKRNRR